MIKRLPLYLCCTVLLLLLGNGTAAAEDHEQKRFTLVIDPGHGGHDAGACGAYSKEKNINLKVALEFGRLVAENCKDVRVIYTRNRDVFIPLQTRADIANRNKADLFISVHTNALPAGKMAYGAETYTLGMARAAANLEVAKRENSVITYEKNYRETYEGFDPGRAESYIIFELMQDRYMKQSVELARCIQQQYVGHAGRRNKGVHQAGFLVLRKTSMPAVLTELGFISTPEEERYLNSDKGVRELGRSLYNGFVRYRNLHDCNLTQQLAPLPKEDDAPAEEAPRTAETPVATAGDRQGTDGPQPAPKEKPAENPQNAPAAEKDSRPVFKVQIFVCDHRLKTNDKRFRGLSPVDCYRENGLFKYTYGSSTSYADIRKSQKEIAGRFPDTFIVAFVDGRRVNLQEAIKLSKKK